MYLIICHCSNTNTKHLALIYLNCRQEIPATPGQPHKEPMLIPLAIGLLDKQGQDMVLTSVYNGESLLSLKGGNGDGLRTVVLRVEKVRSMTCVSNLL